MKTLLLALLSIISFNVFAIENIKIIVPYSPGGSADRIARVLEDQLSNSDYKFIIEFKLGAGGQVAADYVASTKAGTVLLMTSNALIDNPIVTKNHTYFINNDFQLLCYLGIEPMIMVVPVAKKVNNYTSFKKLSMREILPYGTSGVGTVNHLMGVMIANKNPNIVHVPYKGGASALTDLLGGNISWMIESDQLLGPYMAENKLKPIAVYARTRLPKYPNLPTVSEAGIPNRGLYRWYMLLSNTNANQKIVDYVKEKTKDSQIQQNLRNLGLDTTPPTNINLLFQEESDRVHGINRDFLN
jgi:tripartite-type tricarboxylate transporter receptor subunit TctC